MIRTQICIPENLYRDIKLISEKEGIPMSRIMRTLLEIGIYAKSQNIGEELLKLTEIKSHGPSDLSSNIDKYLYDEV
ncbi:MAG: hypothetical protein M1326_05925 [Cyanobacteria bacterium]|nr:hypothetical protein [Cyanobacteriota bacterium]